MQNPQNLTREQKLAEHHHEPPCLWYRGPTFTSSPSHNTNSGIHCCLPEGHGEFADSLCKTNRTQKQLYPAWCWDNSFSTGVRPGSRPTGSETVKDSSAPSLIWPAGCSTEVKRQFTERWSANFCQREASELIQFRFFGKVQPSWLCQSFVLLL